jgi:hypothetical protein
VGLGFDGGAAEFAGVPVEETAARTGLNFKRRTVNHLKGRLTWKEDKQVPSTAGSHEGDVVAQLFSCPVVDMLGI